MKRGIIILSIIALLAVIGIVVFGGSTERAGEREEVAREGVISSINTEEVAYDGPIIVTIDTEEGEEVIAIPSMGIQICEARENIADGYALEVGEFVDVRGTRDDSGRIVPCHSSRHYLRVSTE